MILTSSDKVTKRSTKISDLDFEDAKQVEAVGRPKLKAVE
jgi:hypothetical protein